MESPASPSNGRPDRNLRIITIVAMVPALALLIPSGIVTARPLPAIGLVPMAMSLVVSMAALTSQRSSVRMRPTADTIVALSLLTVLVFSWVYLASNWGIGINAGMLCAYGMTPMMANFCIHTYLALRALPSPRTMLEPRPCPNCNHALPSVFPRWQRHVALPADDTATVQQTRTQNGGGPGHSRSIKEIYQPFLRNHGDEDENVRESSEFQTSGFNTPRQSAETLGSEVRVSLGSEEGTIRGDAKDVSLV